MRLDDFVETSAEEGEVKYEIIEEPTVETISRVINGEQRRYVILIFSNCKIEYKGRAQSTLSDGDRIILIKPDGTLLVHENKKREPVNWQPPGSKISAHIIDDNLVIYSRRDKPREVLKIYVNQLYFIIKMKVQQGKFKLIGSEKDIVDKVQSKPDLLEEGLRIVKREASTPFGYIDLVAIDKAGNTVIIEFKRRTATVSSVLQLARYIKYYSKHVKNNLRGIIVAPKITDEALILLKGLGLEFIKIDPTSILEK